MSYSGNQHLPGLHPVTNGVAGTVPRIRHYDVSSTYAATIGEGCILIKQALGVNLATATVAAGGVLVGVAAANLAATTGGRIPVYDDPSQEYVVVVDGTVTTTVMKESIGQFVQCLSNVYNATLGQGKTIVDISSVTSTRTTTRPYQIVGWPTVAGEANSSTYSQVVIKLADQTHIFASGSVTHIT